ncbi:GNAT family N-acetyltransferase [Desulfogranum japonicum]|uniref:GNAT family N-acetyltransferase n=1 Tax=Desulfogranum japonicum TaxID=231447 RepID=UPI000684C79C|nr:GNAT family N-acetyltransferase [Desulfogranum japonicum]
MENSINNSLCFGVYKNKQQIGFARVITDYTIFTYLADVFIDPKEQHKGFAKRLIGEIINYEQLQTVRRWHLCTMDAHGLYEKFGFSTPKDCNKHMERTTAPNYKHILR